MSAILPFVKIDSSSLLANYFTPYQVAWIEAEDPFHEAKKQVFALAEKSVRIGWTFCDGFKNVRKRLRFKNRDYLFATKDLPSALEYMNDIYNFADMLGYTRAVLSHGEDFIRVKALDPEGKPTGLAQETRIGYIKFENGSRIIAFSSNPYSMAVYGGDVGLDEFAKHPNANFLWETAQGRVTWGCDLAVWSAHDGEDTLFNQFAREARASLITAQEPSQSGTSIAPIHSEREADALDLPAQPKIAVQKSKIKHPWNLYFRVTMPDAVELGLLDIINRTRGTALTPDEFLSDCRARSGSEETYQQAYLCNPTGAATANIVEWSAIERCRSDYEIERLHLESAQILQNFGEFSPNNQHRRESEIADFLRGAFPALFPAGDKKPIKQPRLGFDVAASGQGDLAVIYIDEAKGDELWLRALFTCRTEDWHFLKTVLFFFLKNLRGVQAAGDETGLGRQICWEAGRQFSGRFLKVNFASLKHDLGFALMNQLSVSQKRIPRSQQDIAADYFALRKSHTGSRWVFTEGRNTLNPDSHCDIAWAGALASHAHTECRCQVGAAVVYDHPGITAENAVLWSDDPRIWQRF